MPNTDQPAIVQGMQEIYQLPLKELAEVLVKYYGLKDGIYEPMIEFSIGIGNVGPAHGMTAPSAIVSVTKVGLVKADRESPNSIDASKIKPAKKIVAKKKD
jgi:hypothetical protein